ncbi:fungal-specific transcription factor domain-containing protein [Xylariaceae sp. FL1651]|nr:fungal-specific transcription factor domain-containing protein [Xylariaceae sp. FL1651]
MLIYARTAAQRAPRTRSKKGCDKCREKKKKCDETRPRCTRCIERNVACTYQSADSLEPVRPTREETSSDAVTTVPLERRHSSRSPLNVFREESHTSIALPGLRSDQSCEEHCSDHFISSQEQLYDEAYGTSQLANHVPISPLEVCSPAISEISSLNSRQRLIQYFCDVLSHLIVLWEEPDNPFQQLMLPLSNGSGAVLNAIYALASAHMHSRGIETIENTAYYHTTAIHQLSILVEQTSNANKKETLATIMLLIYYEALVRDDKKTTINWHLRGAYQILSSLNEFDATSLFLMRAFQFYDSITALSMGTAPFSNFPSVQYFSRRDNIPFPSIDALLGFSHTLWPIIHRLSSLHSLKQECDRASLQNQSAKAAVLKVELDNNTKGIERYLQNWQPALHVSVSGDLDDVCATESRGMQPIRDNALAYRHSSLVYLYRNIHDRTIDDEVVQDNTHLALLHCTHTVSQGGAMGALLWPLFTAACEALSDDDKELAKEAFATLGARQGMKNIGRAWAVVKEVWRRTNLSAFSAEPQRDAGLWRRVAAEMGVDIIFG